MPEKTTPHQSRFFPSEEGQPPQKCKITKRSHQVYENKGFASEAMCARQAHTHAEKEGEATPV
jgi:hypothetical protein